MSWQHTLYRAWIVGSIVWVGSWLYRYLLVCASGDDAYRCQLEAPWIGLAIVSVGGPLVLLVLGCLAGGFRWQFIKLESEQVPGAPDRALQRGVGFDSHCTRMFALSSMQAIRKPAQRSAKSDCRDARRRPI